MSNGQPTGADRGYTMPNSLAAIARAVVGRPG